MQRRQVLVEPRLVGLELDRSSQSLDRLLRTAELAQQMAAVGMGLRKAGGLPDGGVVAGQGLCGPHQLLQLLTAIVKRDRVRWIDGERRIDAGQGLRVPPQARKHDAAIVEAGDVARILLKDTVVPGQRLVPAAGPHRGGGAVEHGRGEGQVRVGLHARSSIRPPVPAEHRHGVIGVHRSSRKEKGAGPKTRPPIV